MTSDKRPIKDYRLRVGHWRLRVRARDADEAIELARQQLIRELPRLYDVIHVLAHARFEFEDAA